MTGSVRGQHTPFAAMEKRLAQGQFAGLERNGYRVPVRIRDRETVRA